MLLEHRHEPAELHAVGMRLDLLGLRRQDVARPLQDPLHPLRPAEVDPRVRVGDGRLFEILLDAAPAPLKLRLHLDRHAGPVLDRLAAVVLRHPLDGVLLHQLGAPLAGRDVDSLPLAVQDLGLIGLGVDPQFVVVGGMLGVDLGDDLHRLAGGEHAIHARRRDADALLAAAHPEAMKLGTVEELAEDQRNLLADDARTVVLDAHPEPRPALPDLLDPHPDLREDARLLAGVERVVDRLLDAREQRLARGVEAEQVAVLGEELADGDVPLAGGQGLSGGPPLGRGLAIGFGGTHGRGLRLAGRLGGGSGTRTLRSGSGAGHGNHWEKPVTADFDLPHPAWQGGLSLRVGGRLMADPAGRPHARGPRKGVRVGQNRASAAPRRDAQGGRPPKTLWVWA